MIEPLVAFAVVVDIFVEFWGFVKFFFGRPTLVSLTISWNGLLRISSTSGMTGVWSPFRREGVFEVK